MPDLQWIMLIVYVAGIMQSMESDALGCYSNGCRYRFWRSLFACLFWPLMLVPLSVAEHTKDWPDKPLNERPTNQQGEAK